jgi:hypothetical protein
LWWRVNKTKRNTIQTKRSRRKGDSHETQRRTNKPKKVFPSINELLKQKEVEKSKQEQELMRQKADEQLPESYKYRYVP